MTKTVTEKDWTTAAGLRAVVLLVRGSHRCGYVGVDSTHPLHGIEYGAPIPCMREAAQSATVGSKGVMLALTACCDALADGEVRPSLDTLIDCHGGLTWSDGDDHYPAEAQGVWWFGFDCAHCGDGSLDPGHDWMAGPVRSLEYCVEECESIARQIAGIEKQMVSES